jgi:hypothetical protein
LTAALAAAQTPANPLVEYSTYIGGSGDDYATAVATAPDGSTYVAGESYSRNIAPKTLLDMTLRASSNAFVARLTPDGKQFQWNYAFGGDSATRANAIAIDPSGNVWITGRTGARNFPLLNPVQDKHAGLNIAFLMKLSPEGKLLFSTFLGGERNDEPNAIAIDRDGNVYIAGRVGSTTFPTKRPIPGQYGGGDAFVARFSNDGKLDWSTLFGGTGADEIFGIATGPDGDVYVVGETVSADLATEGAWIQKYFGWAAFAARIKASGEKIEWCTYIGARPGYSRALGVTVDQDGGVYVVGYTSSKELPVTENALQPKYAGGLRDGFLLQLSPDGAHADYLSYVGGSFAGRDPDDEAVAVSLDGHGTVYVAGLTYSGDFATARPVQGAIGGGADAWVARLDLAAGRVVSSTFWGGAKDESLAALALGPGENVTFAGQSASADFPSVNGAQPKSAGNIDGFVSRLCDPWLAASAGELRFAWTAGKSAPDPQELTVFDGCSVKHDMTSALSAAPWLAVTPDRMAMPGKLTASINTAGLEPGEYKTEIAVTVPEAANGVLRVPVVLQVLAPPQE